MRNNDQKIKDALQRAYQLRYAEIGVYWLRALYLWGVSGFLLVAFSLLAQEEPKRFAVRVGLVALPLLGFFIAGAWHFTERGARSWQYSWEKYIAYLEGSVSSQARARLMESFDHTVISKTHLTLFYIVISTWLLLPVLAARPFLVNFLAYDDPGIWGWVGLCFVLVLVIYSFVRGYFENYLQAYARLRARALANKPKDDDSQADSHSHVALRPYALHFSQKHILVDIVVFFTLTMFLVWPFLNYLEGFDELNILGWLGIYFVPVVIICILVYDWMRKHWRVQAEMIGRIHRFLITLMVAVWVVLAVVSGRDLYNYGQDIIAQYVPLEFITERCSDEVIDNVDGWIPRGVVAGLCHFLQPPVEVIEGR